VGGRPKLVTDEIVQHIKRLRDNGISIRKIAAEVGFSKAALIPANWTVRKWSFPR